MSSFSKKLNQYRQGEEFTYINQQNVSEAIKKILTTKEGKKSYDRHGNIAFTDKTKLQSLTIDEQVFRIMVLVETQLEDFEQHFRQENHVQPKYPTGDYEADLAEAKVIAHNVIEDKQ